MFGFPLLFSSQRLHEDLLASAQHFIDQEHYGVAVVLAQTACEVVAEQVRNQLIQERHLSAIGEWIAKRTKNTDLRNEAFQELYVALTNDSISKAAFWLEYTRHVSRRNDVVHRGRRVSKEEAEESCRVVRTMIAHLKHVVRQAAGPRIEGAQ